MKRFLLILLGILGFQTAPAAVEPADVHSDELRQMVEIRFKEPLVRLSAVENGMKTETLPPGDLGLDILTVSGDAAHTPIMRWRDQNRLEIRFPRGTSCATSYQLKLAPGTRFLGGSPAPQKIYEFRCPPDMLSGRAFMDARGLGVMVCSELYNTKESLELSPGSPLRFVFREARRRLLSGDLYYVGGVEAMLEPAYLKQGLSPYSLQLLHKLGEKEWSSLREDSVLPGHVVVRPRTPLDTDKEWHLLLAEPGKGFSNNCPVCDPVTPEPELGSGVDWEDKDGRYRLRVLFSAPMNVADMPALFERMKLAVGQNEARNAGRGRKLLKLGEQEIEFRYAGVVEQGIVKPFHDYWRRDGKTPDLVYCAPGRVRGFAVEVSATAPALLDVVLPAGTASYLGWKTAGVHCHRLTLNPAWPELCPGRLTIVPRHGERCLRLPYANLAGVKVSAWRLPHEMTATALGHKLGDTAPVVARKLEYDLLSAREWRGMAGKPDALDLAESRLDKARATARETAARSRAVLKDATPFAPVELQTGADGMRQQGEMVLRLDDAVGGVPAPGMYLLRLEPRCNAQVRAALRLNERAEESLDSHTDVLVQVTDLNVTVGERALMVNRYSDGQPVPEGTVSYLDEQQQPHQLSIQNGLAWLPAGWKGDCKVVVRSGDDVLLVEVPRRYSWRSGRDSAANSTMMVLDRPIYRPGDTVNLRVVLRRQMPDGSCALPSEKTAKITFSRPDGSNIETRELGLGGFGACEASFTLPVGEDDVAGNYSLRVECGDIRCSETVPCQVFRRDAFKASLSLEVSEQEVTVRVEAADYSGTPLAGGKCMLELGGEQLPLTLDAAGKGVLKRPVTQEMRNQGRVSVSGSVANDREEYVQMQPESRSIHPADFYIRMTGNHVCLYDSRTDKPLGREQKLQLQYQCRERKPLPGPNGLGYMQDKEIVTWSREFTVSAAEEQGVQLPAPEDSSIECDMLVVRGTDAAGRVAELRRPWPIPTYARDENGRLQVTPGDGGLTVTTRLERGGMAHFIVSCGKKDRHLTLPVRPGNHTLRIPLLAGEEGSVRLTMVLPRTEPAGAPLHLSSTCFVPVRQYHLAVELKLPQQICRPAETITLSGKVSADKAAVTLYAVDAGMLSVGRYEIPDPERHFYERIVQGFGICGYGVGDAPRAPSRGILPGFWRGDMVGRGYSLSPGNMDSDFRFSSRIRLSGGSYMGGSGVFRKVSRKMRGAVDGMSEGDYECAPAPCVPPVLNMSAGAGGEEPAPRLRTDFAPVAVWKGELCTGKDGTFSVDVTLPDTLTTYKVIAVAVDASGSRFGATSGEFTVAQPVMLTPGTPLFMSLGDELRLPLSIVNNTDETGTWTVTLEGAATPQEITLGARRSGTLYFDFKAMTEGEQKLRWSALGKPGSDAVQGGFAVRFPAPVLKEAHHLALSAGDSAVQLAALLGSEVGSATRGEMELVASANPVLLMAGAADFLLEYPYGCTEQRASALIPWLLYEDLAPFCPKMAQTRPEDVKQVVQKTIAELLARQCQDGGLAYWGGKEDSSLWATAHAGYVLKLAQEQGYEVPQEAMDRLYRYLWWASVSKETPRTRFAIARTRGKTGQMKSILREMQEDDEKHVWMARETRAATRFLLSLLENPAAGDDAFRTWMRTAGRDYRHGTTQSNAWNLLALAEYLKLRRNQGGKAALVLQEGAQLRLDKGCTVVPLPWKPGQEMKTLPATLAAAGGTVYAILRVRALPATADYPGVTERGLQVTRLYETKGADGIWRPASGFRVGDVVRVTLTCAKVADEFKYLVLEDYLPACMEAINPEVPSQAAGLEPLDWSHWFDHREYLADRVRGFCTRWGGRDLLNMRYYARVKRAGTSAAPPAQAQLMYEPQVYGLSPNSRVLSVP